TFGATSALCDDTGRCSGGVCDARIDTPFASCVARAGDEACPAGFPDKHLVGSEGAELECTGTCGCTVNRAPCQGAVHLYSDGSCNVDEVVVPANGLCGGPDLQGADVDSYRVVATSTTTCTGTGSPAASGVQMKNARTVCCR